MYVTKLSLYYIISMCLDCFGEILIIYFFLQHRGMRERNLQKAVTRFQDYTYTSCKVDNSACKSVFFCSVMVLCYENSKVGVICILFHLFFKQHHFPRILYLYFECFCFIVQFLCCFPKMKK